MSVPTYRERLQVEGAALAVLGGLGSVGLLVFVDESTRLPGNTIGQLAAVAVLLAVFGPRFVGRWLDGAHPVLAGTDPGSGEPTPLWHLPLVVLVLTVPIGLVAGWDAGLRVTAGCLLVGVAQALPLARLVARREREQGVVYVRLPGSRLGKGTKLGAIPAGR